MTEFDPHNRCLAVGKLPSQLLGGLLAKYTIAGDRVVLGPGIGRDAAVIEMGDRLLVAKTDPITFTADEIGWYAVHVNANDVACCGAVPRWFLAALLLPDRGTTPDLVERIFRQISDACRQLGIAFCGGHTEITHGLAQPIVVGHLLGEAQRDRYVTSAGARAGDAVILTKGFAIEGTTILAREKREELRGVLSEADLDRAADFIRLPGISVVKDARIALEVGGVHALHDPTEGGMATGLWELGEASGVGLRIDQDRLPILPECERMCRHFGLDPLGVIASGSLLIAADPGRTDAIVARLNSEGIAAAVVGKVLPAEQGRRLCAADGTSRDLPTFASDEVTRLFG
ncbi:MAG: hydrogenase expression/formation protein [Pirellulales bacterium]|nr:hydrogenase expression/formation protein [Pirellulales bacterium]